MTRKAEFLGIFSNDEEPFPEVIFETTSQFRPELSQEPVVIYIHHAVPSYVIGTSSWFLRPRVVPASQDEEMHYGRIRRVRVVTSGSGHQSYARVVADLMFDPGRWSWGSTGALLAYTTKQG
jgi:hypothetical protein